VRAHGPSTPESKALPSTSQSVLLALGCYRGCCCWVPATKVTPRSYFRFRSSKPPRFHTLRITPPQIRTRAA
jgi:hypothetical protein